MNIRLKWDEIVEIEPKIVDDTSYCISFVFKNGEVCTYGYRDSDTFIKDYTEIMCIRRD